jgi:hypothetical protein
LEHGIFLLINLIEISRHKKALPIFLLDRRLLKSNLVVVTMTYLLIEQYAGKSLQPGPEVQRREIYIGEEHDAQRRTLAGGRLYAVMSAKADICNREV